MSDESLFHLGEQAVQRRLGVFDQIGPWARRVVRPVLPAQHRAFYAELPFLVAAARDTEGRPWATLLAGAPGFAHSPDPARLVIDAATVEGDALEGELGIGSQLGLLGIELATRRRNRVNGVIGSHGIESIELEVAQSFGNCPQYIHERDWEFAPARSERPAAIRSRSLDADLRRRIQRADTFFIASGHRSDGQAASHGMDASHRGGAPGFVSVVNDTRLVFPDYAGNNHFNTIGNLSVDPRAGLVFVDFETGGMLQLTGHTQIDWDSPELERFPGAQRLVFFDVEEVVDLPEALPIRWRTQQDRVAALTVLEKKRESEDVTSFLLVAADAQPLAGFTPGQHLPIELDSADMPDPIRRTYSLSNAPDEGMYRISVKRESMGTASRLLHDVIDVGDSIRTRRPAGDFVLEEADRPIVCLSAGVGITPMLSMLSAQSARGSSRPIHFFHVARDAAHHPFQNEVHSLVESMPNTTLHTYYSQPRSEDQQGRDFDVHGRMSAANVAASLQDLNADFYLCGPIGFMAGLTSGLEDEGVAPDRIHSESFGPATIR